MKMGKYFHDISYEDGVNGRQGDSALYLIYIYEM